jgi:DNA-binding NarL/FixJ family response regulator
MSSDGERSIRVVLVDDHPGYLEFLQQRLRRTPGFEVVGAATAAATALQMVAERHPTILVLDVGLPDISGEEVAREVRERWPDIAIVVLTGYALTELPRALWTMGVAGALTKTAGWPTLKAALQAVAQGYCILPAALAGAAQRGPRVGLTAREQAVLDLLVAGQRNADIARALTIAERTVEFHVNRVLAKLGVHSRTQAAARAQQLGLVDALRTGPRPR